jgi:hypothetical protein
MMPEFGRILPELYPLGPLDQEMWAPVRVVMYRGSNYSNLGEPIGSPAWQR